MTTDEIIYIQKNGETIIAEGKDLEVVLNARIEAEAERVRVEAEREAKEAARRSAFEKLSKLGLTIEEIDAVIGRV